MKKDKKGITLISLIVTIIILIILAGIVISYSIGNKEIISDAQLAKKKAEIARILETLELEKVNLVNEKSFNITLSDYIEHITKKGIIGENDEDNQVINNWNVEYGSCYIKVDGKYYFKIEDDEKRSGNLQITYVEKILLVEMKETLQSDFVEVVVTAKEESKAIKEYEYYIKQKGETLEKKETSTNGNYIYTGLKPKQSYWIKVKVTGENGEQVNLGKWITTGKDSGEPSATIIMSGDDIQESLPVTVYANVKHEDELSEIKIGACRYVVNQESGEIGLNEQVYIGGGFTSNEERIELNLNAVADWYLHVLTVDDEDNKKETIQKITVSEKYHAHTGSSTSGGGCYTQVVNHTHSNTCKAICGGTYHYVGTYEGTIHYKCNRCGTKKYPSTNVGSAYYGECQQRVGSYVCGIPEGASYKLSCGKTETTIDKYKVSY